MRASQRLIDHIKQTECGGKPLLKAVWDKTGRVWMIGYGHSPGDVKQGDKITPAQAEQLLKDDLRKFEDYVTRNCPRACQTQGRFDAVVDFCYNCGIGNYQKSTLKRYIDAGRKLYEIQREFLKWTRSGGVELGGLYTRRIWEAARFAET